MTMISECRIPEIKIRMVRGPVGIAIKNSKDSGGAVRHLCCDNPSVESFCVLYLNAKSHLMAGRLVGMGGVAGVSLMAREIFQGACDVGASAIIIGHNHPSGNPRPSPEDKKMTKQIRDAGEILGISVVDSVIVTECGKEYSFVDQGDFIITNNI